MVTVKTLYSCLDLNVMVTTLKYGTHHPWDRCPEWHMNGPRLEWAPSVSLRLPPSPYHHDTNYFRMQLTTATGSSFNRPLILLAF